MHTHSDVRIYRWCTYIYYTYIINRKQYAYVHIRLKCLPYSTEIMGWLFSFCEVLCCIDLCLLSCPGSSGGRANCLESGGFNSTPGCCFCQWGMLNRVWCDGCVFHLVMMHLQTCDFLTELFLITDIHWNRIETTSMSLASDIAQSSPRFAVCHFQLAKIPACNQLIKKFF